MTSCLSCNQQDLKNTLELLEVLNERLGALLYTLNPPIVKEVNTPNTLPIKYIETVNGKVYNDPVEVVGDTWTGTVTFKKKYKKQNDVIYTLNGAMIESITREIPEEED